MIQKLSSTFVKNGIIVEDDIEIYEYGIFVVLFNLISIGAIILLGFLFNQLSFTLKFLFFYLSNRMIIGGYHCKTPHKCFITFTISYILLLISTRFVSYSDYLYITSILLYVIMLRLYFINSKSFKIFLCTSFVCFILISYFITGMRLSFIYANIFNFILVISEYIHNRNTAN